MKKRRKYEKSTHVHSRYRFGYSFCDVGLLWYPRWSVQRRRLLCERVPVKVPSASGALPSVGAEDRSACLSVRPEAIVKESEMFKRLKKSVHTVYAHEVKRYDN